MSHRVWDDVRYKAVSNKIASSSHIKYIKVISNTCIIAKDPYYLDLPED